MANLNNRLFHGLVGVCSHEPFQNYPLAIPFDLLVISNRTAICLWKSIKLEGVIALVWGRSCVCLAVFAGRSVG